ncbi:MAG: PKD domain-containing protein [Phycisphaerae bacterium]|nr:PKD domain-containing protein [Phycisphaerae bacterium]
MTLIERMTQVRAHGRKLTIGVAVPLWIAAAGFCLAGAGCDTVNLPGPRAPSPVWALFSFTPISPSPGEEVSFHALYTVAVTAIEEYYWDFGDGSTAVLTTSSTTHTYATAGTYTVTLIVTDDSGHTGDSSVQISVSQNAEGSTCEQYVSYYNSLPCVTETLEEAFACYEEMTETCEGVPAFYGCRIENTYCDDEGNLVRDTEQCDLLLDCS